MIIDLNGIPEEGADYSFNRQSEELHGVLDDLVGKNPFQIELRIESMGNSFQVRGKLSSHYQEDCSRCGNQTDVPLQNSINEILVVEEVRPRHSQSVHGQQSVNFSEAIPSVTYINSTQFNLAGFIHEIFAFSMPAYPKCLDAKNCIPVVDEGDGQAGDRGHPAFTELKKIKLKH